MPTSDWKTREREREMKWLDGKHTSSHLKEAELISLIQSCTFSISEYLNVSRRLIEVSSSLLLKFHDAFREIRNLLIDYDKVPRSYYPAKIGTKGKNSLHLWMQVSHFISLKLQTFPTTAACHIDRQSPVPFALKRNTVMLYDHWPSWLPPNFAHQS